MNYRQIYAIKQTNEKRIKDYLPGIKDKSGIYTFYRYENEYTKFYVGQAKHLVQRLSQHLVEYKSHIDLSVKKHGLYSDKNKDGWRIHFFYCEESELDRLEKETIKKMMSKPYVITYNVTGGGQDNGKFDINETERKLPKTYMEGVEYGKEQVRRYVFEMFDKYLCFSIKGKDGKIKQRKFKEFENFLNNSEEQK